MTEYEIALVEVLTRLRDEVEGLKQEVGELTDALASAVRVAVAQGGRRG